MSRIGRKTIEIPEGVKIDLQDKRLTVSGPKGTLTLMINPKVEVKTDDKITVQAGNAKQDQALRGTVRQIIANAILGVTKGWSKTLEVIGTGYRASLEGTKLVLSLGFSHKVEVEPPEGITFTTAENKIIITGADKVLVGQVAAQIRRARPPDAYKGKGVRYLGERVKLKPGKATKAGVSA